MPHSDDDCSGGTYPVRRRRTVAPLGVDPRNLWYLGQADHRSNSDRTVYDSAVFAVINLYSALNHLKSQTWRDGLTTGTILLFPVIDPGYFGIADAVYARAPTLYVLFSKFTTYGMLVWQIGLLPLVLMSRWSRITTIVWGLIFFFFSTHVLAIKTLAPMSTCCSRSYSGRAPGSTTATATH